MGEILQNPSEEEQPTARRTFLRRSIATITALSTGGIAASILTTCHRMEHSDHEVSAEDRRRALEEMLRKASAFREDPKHWWERHWGELFIENPTLTPPAYAIECVDEGDDLNLFLPKQGYKLPQNFDVLSVPGSGVKYPGFAQDLRTLIGTQHIMGITSHKDCGACEGKDDLAITHAKSLAQELSVPYLGHVETLQRPSYHVALGSNLRYTRKVKNLRFAKDAPRYFDASQWCLSSQEARITNIKLMLNIAYHHGFKELFVDQGVPFELVVWYDPSDPLHTKESAADEIQEAFRQADLPQELRKTKGLLKLTFMEVM